jgi:hypothetical protein
MDRDLWITGWIYGYNWITIYHYITARETVFCDNDDVAGDCLSVTPIEATPIFKINC